MCLLTWNIYAELSDASSLIGTELPLDDTSSLNSMSMQRCGFLPHNDVVATPFKQKTESSITNWTNLHIFPTRSVNTSNNTSPSFTRDMMGEVRSSTLYR